MQIRDMKMEDYGISEARSKELMELARLEENRDVLEMAANASNDYLAKYLIVSLSRKRAGFRTLFKYEAFLPCTKNDFYAYRRRTLAFFDSFLRHREELNRDL